MPIYDTQCEQCAHRFEVIHKFSDAPVAVCSKCGGGPVQKLLSSPAIQFKGSGFYLTDYGRGTSGKPDGKSDGKPDGKSDGKSKGDKADSGGSSDSASKRDSGASGASGGSGGSSGGETKTSSSESSTPKAAPAKAD